MFKKIEQFLPLLMIVSSILIAIMIFFPALSDDESNLINGTMAVFGGEIISFGSLINSRVNFNLVNLFAYLLPLVLTVILFILNVRSNKSSIIKFILSAIILASFVFSLIIFLSLGSYTIITTTTFAGTITSDFSNSDLGIGAILSLIIAIIGIVSSTLHILIIAGLKK